MAAKLSEIFPSTFSNCLVCLLMSAYSIIRKFQHDGENRKNWPQERHDVATVQYMEIIGMQQIR